MSSNYLKTNKSNQTNNNKKTFMRNLVMFCCSLWEKKAGAGLGWWNWYKLLTTNSQGSNKRWSLYEKVWQWLEHQPRQKQLMDGACAGTSCWNFTTTPIQAALVKEGLFTTTNKTVQVQEISWSQWSWAKLNLKFVPKLSMSNKNKP